MQGGMPPDMVGTPDIPFAAFRGCLFRGWITPVRLRGFGVIYRATKAGKAAISKLERGTPGD